MDICVRTSIFHGMWSNRCIQPKHCRAQRDQSPECKTPTTKKDSRRRQEFGDQILLGISFFDGAGVALGRQVMRLEGQCSLQPLLYLNRTCFFFNKFDENWIRPMQRPFDLSFRSITLFIYNVNIRRRVLLPLIQIIYQ